MLVPQLGGPEPLRYAVTALALVLLLGWWVRRRGRAAAGRPRPAEAKASIDLPYPATTVWSMIHPAENAPLADPSCVRGYHVPGTPEGVGERQAFVNRKGRTSLIEVVELEPGRRAVTVPVGGLTKHRAGIQIVFAVNPTAAGCTLTLAVRFADAPGWSTWPTRRALERQLSRYAVALETWDSSLSRRSDPGA